MTGRAAATRRRLLAPEVVQTSAMDCGPAALKCLLEGFGVAVSYGRLREACQTDVDGTSIDTVEQIAQELGLDAEQVMLPIDDLLEPAAAALPALVVVRQPSGFTHFVVLWRRCGRFVQVMDPAFGRRWMTRDRFLADVYRHTATVPATAWREWAASPESLALLSRRLERLAVDGRAWIEQARADPGWRTFAALDGASRTVAALVRSGALARGREAQSALGLHLERGLGRFASVAPMPGDEAMLRLHGAVLVRVRRRAGAAAPAETPRSGSIELRAALDEKPMRPARELWRLLRQDGALAPAALLLALAAAAIGALVETLLLRSLLDAGRELVRVDQRATFLGALLAFSTALLLLELPIRGLAQRMGRRLELRFRRAFLAKLPRLSDRYLQSRPVSDMATRGHQLHELREAPELAAQLVRTLLSLVATTAGLIWIDPGCAPIAIAAGALFLVAPWLLQRPLRERDLRLRTHVGGLSAFFLDAFLGLVPIRSHGGEAAVRREQEGLVTEWARAGRSLVRAVASLEAIEALLGLGLVLWLLAGFLARATTTAPVLLFLYWALELPVLGQQAAHLARRVPSLRNVALRLLEPLNALEEPQAPDAAPATALPHAPATVASAPRGVAIELHGVAVRAAGHTLLDAIDLTIPPGQHVAIVGRSGAGKSSLLGLLLGWHRAAQGEVRVDGEPLALGMVERLRRETAWVDPSVQLWNRSALENLLYGAEERAIPSLARVLDEAELTRVIEALPGGLQGRLGEGGALVSGGEGQRMRFGRALVNRTARLVLLDEPFRGLDRALRRTLLARAREAWRGATLLCVTHDVGDTREFERVVVLDEGRIVEEGDPRELLAQSGSSYGALLDAEREVARTLAAAASWRRVRLERGALRERDTGAVA